jgi:SHS2 domain-containing protein
LDSNSFYKTIEHTADIGIEVESPDQPGIFTRSALAMFDLMFGLDRVDPKERRLVKAEGDSLEELLVAWLNEVLYAHAADKMLFSRFTDAELGGNSFSAWGWGERIDPGVHAAEMEIKAATYHGLDFRRTETGWAATIIFDV